MPSSDPIAETVELARRAHEGCRDSLSALVERYRARLLQRIRLMMGPAARRAADSEDFLHDVVLGVVGGIDGATLTDDRAFLRWATGIARNRIMATARRRHEQLVENFASASGLFAGAQDSATPSGEVSGREQAERLVELLEALDEDHRAVLELRHFESLSFREISARLGG